LPVHEKKPASFAKRVSSARRGMRLSAIEGSFATAHAALTGGAFFTGYALFLGANDTLLGILAAVPFLAQAYQLVSAYITERTGKVKAVTVVGGVASRLLWVFPIALLFIPGLAAGARVGLFLAFYAVAYALMFISYNAWTNWMSDLIPARLRGRYFGSRNVAIVIVSLVVTLAAGVALDGFKAASLEREGFATLFGVGVLAAVGAAVFIFKQPILPTKAGDAGAFTAKLRAPLADGNFRRLLLFFATWHFSWALPLAFWTVHQLKYLGMSYFEISLFNVIIGLTSAVGSRLWGKVTDRLGNKPVLIVNALAIGLLPIFWLVPRPGALWPIWLIPFWAGASWAGFSLATFTMPLALAPRETRNYYIAVFGIVTGAITFVGSALGGIIAQYAAGYVWVLGGVTFMNYHMLFVVSAAGRFVSVLFLKGVREPKATPVRAAVAFMGDALYERLTAVTQIIPIPAWARLPRRRNNHESD
jgi:MFS family permease